MNVFLSYFIFMNRLSFQLIMLLLCSVTASAQNFVASGLIYTITSSTDKTVAVAGRTAAQDEYVGSLVIPSEVSYNNVTYSVTSVANNAFSGHSIYDVTLPEGIVSIGNSAFSGTPISDVKIPATVQSIGSYAFGGVWDDCPDNDESYCYVYYPQTYTVANGNQVYSSYRGILYDKAQTKILDVPYGYNQDVYLPASLKEIPSDAFNRRVPLWGKAMYIRNLSNFCQINVTGDIGPSAYSDYKFGDVFPIFNNVYYYDDDYNRYEELSGVLKIPADVKTIGRGIFNRCRKLTGVSFPAMGVTEIGDYAFAETKLTSVSLPASIQVIGQNAFYGSWVESIDTGELDEDDDPIYNYVNWSMAMSSLTIPRNVTNIGTMAFNLANGATVKSNISVPMPISNSFVNASNCTLTVPVGTRSAYTQTAGWNSFNIIEDVDGVPYVDGEIFTAITDEGIEMTFKVLSAANKTAQVGDGANCAIDNTFDGDLVVPGSINGLSVTAIAPKAFYQCSYLQSVVVQEGIIKIGEWGTSKNASAGAFSYSKIANSITLPNTLSFMGMYSFYKAEIGDITLPATLECLDENAFWEAKVGTMNIPYSEQSLGCKCEKVTGFNYTSFANADIGVLNIDRQVRNISFDSCAPFTYTTIGELHIGQNGYASFANCAVTDYYPKVAETLQQGDFYYNKYATPSGGNSTCKNVHLPEGYITIMKKPYGTETMNFPSTVTTISSDAQISLDQAIVLPAGLSSIGDNAITSAVSVTALADYPIEINETAFSSSVYEKTLFVPTGAKERYMAATGWSMFANIEEVGDLGNVIQFADPEVNRICVQYYDINGDGAISEGEAAIVTTLTGFYNNSDITSFNELGTYFTNLQSFSFNQCTKLTSVTIPSNVTSIGDYAFYNCYRLASVIVDIETPLVINSSTFSNRANATLYVPAGSKAAYQSADYWKDFSVIKEYPNGDVNQDGEIDMVDVVDIARYVISTPSESFDVFLADINGDKSVNVADAVVLVNEITGNQYFAKSMKAPQHGANTDVLSLTENDNHSLSLVIGTQQSYTAFQFDLMLPEGVEVTQMNLVSPNNQKHQLLYNKVDNGHYRVVALSTSNRVLDVNNGEILSIMLNGLPTNDVGIENIHFVTARGIDVALGALSLSKNGIATSIENHDVIPSSVVNTPVYNLNGQRLNGLQKGLNIVNRKKVVIK